MWEISSCCPPISLAFWTHAKWSKHAVCTGLARYETLIHSNYLTFTTYIHYLTGVQRVYDAGLLLPSPPEYSLACISVAIVLVILA
jgi:hypothetical protein